MEPAERFELGGDATLPARRQLTSRQTDVLRLVVAGHSNKEIAAQLMISQQTAKWHVSRLFLAFDVSNRAGLVRAAVGPAHGGSP